MYTLLSACRACTIRIIQYTKGETHLIVQCVKENRLERMMINDNIMMNGMNKNQRLWCLKLMLDRLTNGMNIKLDGIMYDGTHKTIQLNHIIDDNGNAVFNNYEFIYKTLADNIYHHDNTDYHYMTFSADDIEAFYKE